MPGRFSVPAIWACGFPPATCMRITAAEVALDRDIADLANGANRWVAFCFEAGAGFEASDSTASLEVRNNVYPLPRARYFTCGSVCPRFGSKATGKLLKLTCRDGCDAGDNASPLLAVPRQDARCKVVARIAKTTQPIKTHVRDNPSLRLG